MSVKSRIIAIYLPQFHPFKENDEWWGKGFTEWRNVAKARPRFWGHYQPHIPTDLGFYDLRVPEVRIEQAKMAQEHGIYGFCYYHYWFNGHLLMERPLEDMLNSREPNFPFMICWANENWTRAWDAGEKEILIQQNYSEEDDVNHIKYLMKFLKDPRYIRVNDKPVLCIYRSTKLPNVDKTIEIWQKEALKENIELYICRFESHGEEGEIFLSKGIDAAIEFQPHNTKQYLQYKEIIKRAINKLCRAMAGRNLFQINIDYSKYVKFQLKQSLPAYKYYPCVTPMWDNSPRRKNDYFAFYNSTPKLFGVWFKNIIEKFLPYSDEENFIFINAWNEWAEGNHLEPDMKWGDAYLKVLKKVIMQNNLMK
jgi:lipopolysaccharide biosynthesis protein